MYNVIPLLKGSVLDALIRTLNTAGFSGSDLPRQDAPTGRKLSRSSPSVPGPEEAEKGQTTRRPQHDMVRVIRSHAPHSPDLPQNGRGDGEAFTPHSTSIPLSTLDPSQHIVKSSQNWHEGISKALLNVKELHPSHIGLDGPVLQAL